MPTWATAVSSSGWTIASVAQVVCAADAALEVRARRRRGTASDRAHWQPRACLRRSSRRRAADARLHEIGGYGAPAVPPRCSAAWASWIVTSHGWYRIRRLAHAAQSARALMSRSDLAIARRTDEPPRSRRDVWLESWLAQLIAGTLILGPSRPRFAERLRDRCRPSTIWRIRALHRQLIRPVPAEDADRQFAVQAGDARAKQLAERRQIDIRSVRRAFPRQGHQGTAGAEPGARPAWSASPRPTSMRRSISRFGSARAPHPLLTLEDVSVGYRIVIGAWAEVNMTLRRGARLTARLKWRWQVDADQVVVGHWGKTPRAVGCRQKRRERLTGEVRGLPQEPPTTRGHWRDQVRKSPNRERLGLCLLVEVGGIEPPSASPLQADLHT